MLGRTSLIICATTLFVTPVFAAEGAATGNGTSTLSGPASSGGKSDGMKSSGGMMKKDGGNNMKSGSGGPGPAGSATKTGGPSGGLPGHE